MIVSVYRIEVIKIIKLFFIYVKKVLKNQKQICWKDYISKNYYMKNFIRENRLKSYNPVKQTSGVWSQLGSKILRLKGRNKI